MSPPTSPAARRAQRDTPSTAPSISARTEAAQRQAASAPPSWGVATLGNGALARSMSGEDLGGLGPVLRQEQAFVAAGMQSDVGTENTSMQLALRRRIHRNAFGLSGDGERALDRATRASGRPLDPEQRVRFEQAFDHDFSHVRIHADSAAARASEALNAHAFALGAEVFFGAGAFSPGTARGDRLLAHELTHVVQHDEGRLPTASPGDGLQVSHPSDPHELEAYANEARIVGALDAPVAGQADVGVGSASGPTGEAAAATGAIGDDGAAVSRHAADSGVGEGEVQGSADGARGEDPSQGAGQPGVPLRERILASRGEPLPSDVAGAVAEVVGGDVSHVIVHEDAVAAEVGERVGRQVYSIGWHLFLAGGPSLDELGHGALRDELHHIATTEATGEEAALARALDRGPDAAAPEASEPETEAHGSGGSDASSSSGASGPGTSEAASPPEAGVESTPAEDTLPGVTDRTEDDAEQATAEEQAEEEDKDEDKDNDEDKDKEDEDEGKDEDEDTESDASEAPSVAAATASEAMSADVELPPTFAELTAGALSGYAEEKAIHAAWSDATAEAAPAEMPSAGEFVGSTLESMADGGELTLMQLGLSQVGIGMGANGRPTMNLKAGEGLAGGKNFAGGFLVLGHMAMVGPEQWFTDMGAATLGKGREGVEKLFGEDSDLITRIAGFIDIADAVNNAILYASYIAQAIAAVCFALAAALSSNPFTAGLAPALLTIANFALSVGEMLGTVNTVFGLVIMGLRAVHVIAQAMRLAIEDADPVTQAERVIALQESVGGLASELTQRAITGAAEGGGKASDFGTPDNHTAFFRDEAERVMDEVASGPSVEAPAPPTLEDLGIPEGVELTPPPVEREQELDRAVLAMAHLDVQAAETLDLAAGLEDADAQVQREQSQLGDNQVRIGEHQAAAQDQLQELEDKEVAAQRGQEEVDAIVDEGMQTQGTASEMFGLMGQALGMLLSLFGMAPSDAGDTDADTGGMQGGADEAVASADPVPDSGEAAGGAVETTRTEIADATAGTQVGQEQMTAIEARIAAEQEANQAQQETVASTRSDAEAHLEAVQAARDAQQAAYDAALESMQSWAELHQAERLPDAVSDRLQNRLGDGSREEEPASGMEALDAEADALGASAFL